MLDNPSTRYSLGDRMKKQVIASLASVLGLFVVASQASAHVITIGYTPGANAGEVNLWLGSYHFNNIGDGPNIEGSARLQGPGGYDTTTLFTTAAVSLPAGLVQGVNYFHDP